MSGRTTPEAWLVTSSAAPSGPTWDEAVAGVAALRALGLAPRVVVLAAESSAGLAEWPLDTTVLEADALAHLADSRTVRDAVDHLARRRGRPILLVAIDGDPAVDGLARVAARWGCRVLAGVRSWRVVTEALDCTCEGLGGQGTEHSLLEPAGTTVLTLADSFGAHARLPGQLVPRTVEVVAVPDLLTDAVVVRVLDATPPLADMTVAPIVVAGGLGLGSPAAVALVDDLAEALGGAVGGTRPIVDLGWMPQDRLIGATGRGIAPALYVALGISGATQHVSSIRARTVISVNVDPAATMTRMADLGLVGDVHEVVPALVDAIREYRP